MIHRKSTALSALTPILALLAPSLAQAKLCVEANIDPSTLKIAEAQTGEKRVIAEFDVTIDPLLRKEITESLDEARDLVVKANSRSPWPTVIFTGGGAIGGGVIGFFSGGIPSWGFGAVPAGVVGAGIGAGIGYGAEELSYEYIRKPLWDWATGWSENREEIYDLIEFAPILLEADRLGENCKIISEKSFREHATQISSAAGLKSERAEIAMTLEYLQDPNNRISAGEMDENAAAAQAQLEAASAK